MNLLYSFVAGTISCVGFCILINIPRRSIAVASFIGGFGFLTYQFCIINGSTPGTSAFVGACAVALLSDLCSRKFKEAATIFIIPGILPLVPGAGMYYTMKALIDGNYDLAADKANSTFLIAGAIAMALLVVGSIIRTCLSIFKKIRW